MKFSLKQLLLVSLASWSTAQHYESPVEIDVESPSMCKTNSDGFGGRPLSTEIYKESPYYYELTITGTDTEAAISDLEIRIADYLLAESSLFDVCARRLKKVPSRSVRRLQPATGAVAITTRPDDLPYDDSKFEVFVVSSAESESRDSPSLFLVECSSSSDLPDGKTCVVVEGAYRVYFEEDSANTDAVMIQMNQAVKKGMDEDLFVGGDIENVEWTESPQPNNAGAVNNGESPTVRSVGDDGVNSTPIIVGASVGGLAAIGLITFYRRRSKGNDEDTFTAPPDGSATYATY